MPIIIERFIIFARLHGEKRQIDFAIKLLVITAEFFAHLGFDLLSRFASFFGAVNHTHRIAFVTFLLQRFLHLFGYVRGFAAQTEDIALIELIVWSLGCEWLAQNTSHKLCHTLLAAGV